jgi:uncharacterized protein YprB with RNaseH-like and TPR domain
MLTSSFIHIPKIGFKTERQLWGQGILTWDDFILDFYKMELQDALKEQCLETIEESKNCLSRFNPKFFMRRLPRSESWRLYKEFEKETAFVDIETDGSTGHGAVTVIGVYNGRKYKDFVKYENLIDAEDELSGYKLIVTYNGANFDLPLIYELFPALKWKHLHIDVMYPLRRLGYRGGLKKVENSLGIQRSLRTRGLDGWDAVRLWHEYEKGKDILLELLLKYNSEDCKNLKPLMEFAYKSLKKQTFDRYCLRY